MTIPPPAFFGQGRATTPSGQMLAVSDDAVLCDADAATGPLRSLVNSAGVARVWLGTHW